MHTITINEGGAEALASLNGTLLGFPLLFKNINPDYPNNRFYFDLVNFYSTAFNFQGDNIAWDELDTSVQPQPAIIRSIQP
jgi:hypothetical protein